MRYVKVVAPATLSNVGPGFDLLGFALDEPEDIMIIQKNSSLTLKIINHSDSHIPEDPLENVATIAAGAMLKALGINEGFDFIFERKINPGSGIGSSAASCTAAVMGVNELLNKPFSKPELLNFALVGECAASGSIHADNVAPALFGGFILIRSYSPMDIISIKFPADLFCTVIHPNIEIKTSESRKLIPNRFPIHTVLEQCGNIAALISGLGSSDFELIGRALEDAIAEPIRANMIPGYNEIKANARKNGALGANISGSGPSIFALSNTLENAQKVGSYMVNTFENLGIKNDLYISGVNKNGTRIVE